MPTSLTTQPWLLDLGPKIVCAGFAVVDHVAIIDELGALEAERLPERAVRKRRAEFLAGRWAARQALRALGVDGDVGRNDDGSPRWPALVAGSITHGAERALCAVASRSRLTSLGIDAEGLMSEDAKSELMARICSDAERAVLSAGLASPESHRVTFAFSAKESLYKCLYPLVGRFMDFSSARVVAARAEADGATLRGELLLELSEDWSPELRQGRQFSARFAASNSHVESAVLLPA